MKFISVAYFFGSEYICLFVRICCVCCVLSVPPAVKPIGIQRQESAREREREGDPTEEGWRENKRIAFIISQSQRNLITLIEQRGLIATDWIRCAEDL